MSGGISLIIHEDASPPYNLALDEVLLTSVSRGYRSGVIRVWVNPTSIIIGSGLEVCEEVYCDEALELGIPVYRRISGGGAVYHDLGNINISIILRSWGATVDSVYRLGLEFILGVLDRLGVKGRVENVNDVVVSGYKVSGSSAYIKPNAFLFHATLLVDSDISLLRRVIKPRLDRVLRGEVSPSKYNPGNLKWFTDVDVRTAINVVKDHVKESFNNIAKGEFSEWEVEEALKLATSKYRDLLALHRIREQV